VTAAEIDMTWYKLVEEYSSCKLTKDEDILVAISGIAKSWRDITGDEYLAGIWQRSLAFGLLWRANRNATKYFGCTRCPTWRAPSWSWASIKGAVTWSSNVIPSIITSELCPNLSPVEVMIELLSTDIRDLGGDSTGYPTSASISIRGVVMLAVAAVKGSIPEDKKSLETAIHNIGLLRLEEAMSLETYIKNLGLCYRHGLAVRQIKLSAGSLDYEGAVHFDDDNKFRELQRQDECVLFCLPVIMRLSRDAEYGGCSGPEVHFVLDGLVLEDVDKARHDPRTYERIGYFAVSSQLDSLEGANALFHELTSLPLSERMRRLGYGEVENITIK
jgi:hypothetical protein